MPIGPCEPNKWMNKTHINAEEAGQALRSCEPAYLFRCTGVRIVLELIITSSLRRLLALVATGTEPAAQELITVKMGQRYDNCSRISSHCLQANRKIFILY